MSNLTNWFNLQHLCIQPPYPASVLTSWITQFWSYFGGFFRKGRYLPLHSDLLEEPCKIFYIAVISASVVNHPSAVLKDWLCAGNAHRVNLVLASHPTKRSIQVIAADMWPSHGSVCRTETKKYKWK